MPKGFLILNSFKTASVLGMIAIILICLPAEMTEPLRNLVRESFVPGSRLISLVKSGFEKKPEDSIERPEIPEETFEQLASLKEELEGAKSEILKLKSQNIHLNDKLLSFRNNGKPEFQGEKSEPLFVPNLLQARVIGEEMTREPFAKQILKIGSRDGVSRENMVIQAEQILVDQGSEQGISANQLALTGRTLLGRITEAGLHTSTLQLVTDPDFRAKVHIYPSDTTNPTHSGEGVLMGSGEDFCTLKFVPTTQPVSVGDDIYTADSSESLPSPVYIGKIVEASHQSDEQFWSIKVQPAMKDKHPETVQVVRTILNPKRLAAK